MANIARSISAPVGIRSGQTMMPNNPTDLVTIRDLLDRIKISDGGSAEIAGVWATDRNALINEITAQIVTFQTVNNRPSIDGVVDPAGGSLRLMNQLAADGPPTPGGLIAATVETAPDGLSETAAAGIHVVNTAQMPGTGMIDPTVIGFDYVRKLVRVEGSSIKWFGVVFRNSGGSISNGIPHINFTPTPIQGGYSDATYDSFGGWGNLWRDYTHVIGSQMVAAAVDQILVIPFYKTSQSSNLGDFLLNWKDVVSEVVKAAILSVDIFYLRDGYTFDQIVTSSFSNGWVAHHGFSTKAAGASSMTKLIIDLDGVAGGSHWTPANGLIYRNRAPTNVNPMGNIWYVGGRWSKKFAAIYGGTLNSHAACRNHLLYHGLTLFGT
ncbi:MAG: hypothetical protein ABI999_17065 [Acidobacteriota bacterium]